MIESIQIPSISAQIRSEIDVDLNDLKSTFDVMYSENISNSAPEVVQVNSSQTSNQASNDNAANNTNNGTSTVPIDTSVNTNTTTNTNNNVTNNIPVTSIPITPSNVYDYDSIIKEMSTKYQVPENLIRSVIKAESNFNPDAVSKSGAKGLMQLMPDTASDMGVTDVMDPTQNIEGGTKYLHQLLTHYNNDYVKAVAAYNAGPTNVDKYGGVPPFEETINYVKKVLNV
jgi:membrane-bound lytic murein transglycosylase B